jgi:hypothetical protein
VVERGCLTDVDAFFFAAGSLLELEVRGMMNVCKKDHRKSKKIELANPISCVDHFSSQSLHFKSKTNQQ